MQKNEALPPNILYALYLRTIQNVNFTQREVDVIACLLNGRSSKKISSFLNISPRTADSHIRNISHKLECYSRESIIDFIEKSEEYPVVKNYYSNLVINAAFEKNLKEISGANKTGLCSLAYDRELEGEDALLFHQIKNHLLLIVEQLPLEVIRDRRGLQKLVSCPKGHILYVLSDKLLKRLQINEGDALLKSFSQPQDNLNPYKALYVLLENEEGRLDAILPQDNLITFKDTANYYLSFFKLLKQLCPSQNFEDYVQEITSLCEKNSFSFDIQRSLPTPSIKETEHIEHPPLDKLRRSFVNWKRLTIGILGAVVFSIVSFIFFKASEYTEEHPISRNPQGLYVQSNLSVPMESTFLNRSELIDQIDNTFKGKEGIQSTALVGIGGAGKTTLARRYAHQQKAPIIWEINAETQESLKASFEDLAQEVSKTAEDQKILRVLLDIKNPEEKEKKILAFVKDRLRASSNWFLIFDNVENFNGLQSYFPQDSRAWGRGKVILTTQNRNVQNSSRINETIMIQELNEDQKLQLFTQIMYRGESKELSAVKKEEALQFLKQIPPFPLDVSVAVNYLKTTNISYRQYLDQLNKQDENFLALQEKLQKEGGEYAKTRYNIITLPLEKLISTDKNFVDLLFLLSLIDSQNIPRELLEKYKGGTIVDNFIYFLKNYSLIDHELTPSSTAEKTFSIHRSTQKISLTYLIKVLGLEKTNKVIQSLFYALGQYTDEVIEQRNQQKMKILIEHYKMLLKYNQLNDPLRGVIYGALGRIYCLLGRYVEAKEYLEKQLNIISKNDNKNPTEILQVLSYLANTYREVGNYEKAKDLLTHSLMIYKSQPSKDYLGISQALIYLGNIYRELGNYEEAKNLFEESHTLHEKYHPENHNFRAWVLSSLGNIYKELGDYKKSKDLLEKSLAVYKKHLSHTHTYYVWTLILLGEVHEKLGYYEKAKELFEQAREINKEWHPDNHSFRAWILARLGNVYGKLENHQESKNLLEQALAIYKQSHFPEDHLYVTWILTSLGNVCKDLGDYAQAKIWLNKSLGIYEKHFGKNHVETARVLSNLGQVYLLEGRLRNAEDLLFRSFNIFQKSNHPDIYMVFEGLTALYLEKAKIAFQGGDRKKYQEFRTQAINYLKNAQEIIKNHFPQGSSHFLRIQSKLKKLESL